MANIQFLDGAKSGCKGAVSPIIVQEAPIVFNTALDGTAPTVITGAATGEAVPYGGTFINRGCEDLTATITFLNGSDCDSCSVDTLSPAPVNIVVPANTVFEMPSGFWTGISYVLNNAAADEKVQTVSFQSFYTPDCPECVILAP